MNAVARPKVSVCIPTYKGAATIGATIESVLAQSLGDFELIVIDDGSPDDTRAVVSRYADPRLRCIVNPRNLGPVGNWNRCLELAQGEYYKLLPHDDLLAPDCLRQQVEAFEADRDDRIALAFGWRQVIGATGRPLMRRGLHRAPRGPVPARDLMRRCVRAGTNLIGEPGAGLMRLALARRLGGYTPNHPYLIDLDFWFRALAHGDAFHTGTCSSSFRLSASSWSVAIGRRQFADFMDFVDGSDALREGGISAADRSIGLARARFNMLLRRMVYRFAG